MSSTSRGNGVSNHLHGDDDDDEDLPVIAIDHLRAVMLPGHLSNDEMHHPISGIHLGGSSGVDLLFQLDESDPLVREFDENINANAAKLSLVESVRAAPEKSSLNEKSTAATVQLSSASTSKESEDLSSSPDYPHNLMYQEQAAINESTSSPSNAADNQLQSTATTRADSARTSESGGIHAPSISSTLPNQQSESPPSSSERSGSTSSSNSSRSDMDFSEYNDDVSFVNDDDNDDDDYKSIDEQDLAGEDRLLITQADTESPKPRLRSAVGTNISRYVSDVFGGDGHEESDPRRGSNLVRTDPGMSFMETSEDRNNDEISIPSPPLLISEDNLNLEVNELELDRQIEEYLLDKTDRSILAAEERELFERYERQISESEEREKRKEESDRAQLDIDEVEMLARYEKSISAAEERDRQKIERAQQHATKLRKERELRSERSRGPTEDGCNAIIGLSDNEQQNERSKGPAHENNLADHYNLQNQVEAPEKDGGDVESISLPPQQPTFSLQSQAEIVEGETDRLRMIHQKRLQEQQQLMLRRREAKLRDEKLLNQQQLQHQISRGHRRPSQDQSSSWHANKPQLVEESSSSHRKSQQPQQLNQHQRREDDNNVQLQQQKQRQQYVHNRFEPNLGAPESHLLLEQSVVRLHSQEAKSVGQRKLPRPQESLQGRRNGVDETDYQQQDNRNKLRESTVGAKGDARQKHVIVAGQHIASAQNNDGTGTQSQGLHLPHDEGGLLQSRNVSSKRPINFQPQEVEKLPRVEKVTQVRKGPQDYDSSNGEEKSREAIGENTQQREILSDSAKIRASRNELTQRKDQDKLTRLPGANRRQGHYEPQEGKISETTTEHQAQDGKVDKAGEKLHKKKISQEKKRIEQERFRKQQLMRNKRLQQEVRHRDLLDHVSTDRKRHPSDNSETKATKKRRVEYQTITSIHENNIDEDRNESFEEIRTRDEVPHEEEVAMSLSAKVQARQSIFQSRRRPLMRQRSLCVNPILDDINAWSNLEDVDFIYASDDSKTEDRFCDLADIDISSTRRLPTRLLLSDGYSSKRKSGGLESGSVSTVFDIAKATKIVPRYLESDLKIEFLSDLDIRQHFFTKLLKDSKIKPLSMTIKRFNPSSWLVEFKGCASLVELARHELKTLITSKIKMWQYARINRKGIIKNVTLDSKRTVGAQITVVRNESDDTHFLSIRPHSTGDSQLAIALGPEASKSDAIVMSVNGAACTTILDFKKLADRMKENLQLQLRILLPENAAVQTWSNAITWHDALSCYRDSSRTSVTDETTPPTVAATNDANGKDDLRSRNGHDSTEESRDVVESQSRNDNLQRRGSLQSTAIQSGNGLAAPEVAVTTRAPDQKGDTPDRLVNYENFTKKFREIAATEFKDVDIHKQSVMLAMWHRHTDRYGGLCSDDCKCFLDLPYLTETVVESRVRKKEANRMLLHDEKYPIGLTGNFAATFLPFLNDQYPNEKGSDILHRLLEMWKLHFNGEYGKKCLKSCSCKAGWVTFFNKGRLGKNLGGLARGSSAAEIAQRKERLKQIVRRKARLPLEEEASMPERATASSIKDSVVASHGSKRKGDVLDNVILPRKKGKQSQKQSTSRSGEGSGSSFAEYTLEFSCQKALGFYCMTDENETGKYCRILSVCPIGQGVDDLRIQAGTTILSFFSDLNSEWIPIKSHIELREIFEKCRLNSSSIRLKCVNTYVTESHVASVRKKEWTQIGQWRGKESFGWDGGAALIDPQNAFQTQSVVSSTNKSAELAVPGKQSTACVPIVEDAQMWKTVDTPRQLIDQRPVSLLKAAGNKTKTCVKEKKIRFAGSFERRQYVLGTLPREFLILSDNSARDESPRLVPKAITCNDKLRQIIQNGSSDDLIRYFQQGALENDKSSDNLIRIREEMKNEMSSLMERLKCAPSDQNLKDKKAELERKDVVMKVYINAFYIVSHARALKQYERFRIEASAIQDLVLSSILEVHAGSILKATVTMVYENGNYPELMCNLPDRPLQKFVDFGSSAPPFYVNYNQTLTNKRAVDVALSMVDPKGEVTVLGSIEILVSELHAKCSHTREPQEITITAAKHDYVEMAYLRLCVSRVDLEPVDYIETKRKALCMNLYRVAEWIERFNKDASSQDHESLSFSADVRIFDNISLLHSAIFLRDFTLVEILLKLGANPLAKSKIGSSLSVVKNMTDGMVTTRRNHMLDDDNDDEGKNIEDASQSNAKNDANREWLETLLSLLVNHVRRP